MDNSQVTQLTNNLVNLSREFKTQEPEQAAALKRAFKGKSHNDLARTVVYLMEVVGVSDMRLKTVQKENKDLREILELNNIKLGEEDVKTEEGTEKSEEANVSATVSGDAAQDSVSGI